MHACIDDVEPSFLSCFRNFLFAPSDKNSYEFSTFTGIRDAFAEYLKTRSVASDRENEARVAVEQQISMVTLAIQSAYSILAEEEYFRWLQTKLHILSIFTNDLLGCEAALSVMRAVWLLKKLTDELLR